MFSSFIAKSCLYFSSLSLFFSYKDLGSNFDFESEPEDINFASPSNFATTFSVFAAAASSALTVDFSTVLGPESAGPIAVDFTGSASAGGVKLSTFSSFSFTTIESVGAINSAIIIFYFFSYSTPLGPVSFSPGFKLFHCLLNSFCVIGFT